MRRYRATLVAAAAYLVGSACAGPPPAGAGASAPFPVPARSGPLTLSVVYPPVQGQAAATSGEWQALAADPAYAIAGRDSAFLFGGTGRGDASLAVNGRPVPVYPTGGWIAWLPVPDDSVAAFQIEATAGPDTARITLSVPVARRFGPPAVGPWIDSSSMGPVGPVWMRPGEGATLRVQASEGAQVQALFPDGSTLPFVSEMRHPEAAWGDLAFDRSIGEDAASERSTWYAAWVTRAFGPDPGPIDTPDVGPPADSEWVWLQAVRGTDTVRARWPLRLGLIDDTKSVVVVVDDDTARTGATDRVLAGRPSPWGTYHWFFPTGTVAVIDGRRGDQVRLRLADRHVAWVDAGDVHAQPPGTPPPRGVVRSLRLSPGERSVVLRIPVSVRAPFRIDEGERVLTVRLYGAVADADWVQYGGTDSLVRLIAFDQTEADVVSVRVELAQPVWGYRTRWTDEALEVEIRRPPVIDGRRPLRGRRIALDAGHPPGGARGPTGSREADVVLAVARETQRLLEDAGASVFMVRTDDRSLGIVERLRAIERSDADVLVSVHANALPDGVNPFENSGTSVYYYHPRSAPLARALDQALVRQLGVRDLGFGRADLALARPTWMPAALTEGLFLMLPDQEAMLLDPIGQRRYARGIVDGLRTFLSQHAAPR